MNGQTRTARIAAALCFGMAAVAYSTEISPSDLFFGPQEPESLTLYGEIELQSEDFRPPDHSIEVLAERLAPLLETISGRYHPAPPEPLQCGEETREKIAAILAGGDETRLEDEGGRLIADLPEGSVDAAVARLHLELLPAFRKFYFRDAFVSFGAEGLRGLERQLHIVVPTFLPQITREQAEEIAPVLEGLLAGFNGETPLPAKDRALAGEAAALAYLFGTGDPESTEPWNRIPLFTTENLLFAHLAARFGVDHLPEGSPEQSTMLSHMWLAADTFNRTVLREAKARGENTEDLPSIPHYDLLPRMMRLYRANAESNAPFSREIRFGLDVQFVKALSDRRRDAEVVRLASLVYEDYMQFDGAPRHGLAVMHSYWIAAALRLRQYDEARRVADQAQTIRSSNPLEDMELEFYRRRASGRASNIPGMQAADALRRAVVE